MRSTRNIIEAIPKSHFHTTRSLSEFKHISRIASVNSWVPPLDASTNTVFKVGMAVSLANIALGTISHQPEAIVVGASLFVGNIYIANKIYKNAMAQRKIHFYQALDNLGFNDKEKASITTIFRLLEISYDHHTRAYDKTSSEAARVWIITQLQEIETTIKNKNSVSPLFMSLPKEKQLLYIDALRQFYPGITKYKENHAVFARFTLQLCEDTYKKNDAYYKQESSLMPKPSL